MQAKHQANRLEHLMKERNIDSGYRISLPPVAVKRSRMATLKNGDMILLNLPRLELVLLDSLGIVCAKVEIEASNSLNVTELVIKNSEKMKSSYQVLTFILGALESHTLETRSSLQNSELQFDTVTIVSEGKRLAEGSLVWIDEKICVSVDEVM